MAGRCPRRSRCSASSRCPPLKRPEPLTSVALALTCIAYVALAFGYAALTPIWQNPDEPAHFNYIAFVARTGGLPDLEPGDWDSALLERLKNGRLLAGDDIGRIRYEAWQPPLYYLLMAPIMRVGAGADAGALVFRLRAANVLIGGATLCLAYLVGREVFRVVLRPDGQRFATRLAVGVPLTLAGVPMFTSVAASVSADPLANLIAAGLVLVLVRRLACPRRAGDRWALGTGALLGVGLLTKLALAIFVPLVLAVVLVRAVRPTREVGLLGAVCAALLAPWLVHQVTTYGWLDPLATGRHAAVVLDQQRFPGLSPEYLRDFGTITFHSFWAQFGWMGVVAPDRLYLAYGWWTLVAAVGLARRRRLFGMPEWRLMLATSAAAVLGLVAYNLAFEQFQGRYLFPALVPIAVLLVGGWAAWLPRSAQAWGVLLVGVLLVAFNAYALLRVLVPGFGAVG